MAQLLLFVYFRFFQKANTFVKAPCPFCVWRAQSKLLFCRFSSILKPVLCIFLRSGSKFGSESHWLIAGREGYFSSRKYSAQSQSARHNAMPANKKYRQTYKLQFSALNFFLKTFCKRFSNFPKTFKAIWKIFEKYIFQNLLGRKFWVIISAILFALSQARSPVKTPPRVPPPI